MQNTEGNSVLASGGWHEGEGTRGRIYRGRALSFKLRWLTATHSPLPSTPLHELSTLHRSKELARFHRYALDITSDVGSFGGGVDVTFGRSGFANDKEMFIGRTLSREEQRGRVGDYWRVGHNIFRSRKSMAPSSPAKEDQGT